MAYGAILQIGVFVGAIASVGAVGGTSKVILMLLV